MASHTHTKEKHMSVQWEDGTIMCDEEVDAMVLLIKRGELITKETVRAIAWACVEHGVFGCHCD